MAETVAPDAPAQRSSKSPQEQRCVGVGWVKFDRAQIAQVASSTSSSASSTSPPPAEDPVSPASREGISAEKSRTPQLRCAGLQFAQAFTVASRRSRETLGGSTNAGSSTSPANSEISDDTWAFVCAGQLSMIVPPGAPLPSTSSPVNDHPGLAAGHPGLAAGGYWSPFRVRCAGLSVRLDSVGAEESNSSEANMQSGGSSPSHEKGTPSRTGGAFPQESEEVEENIHNLAEEWSRSAVRGAQSVAGRASLILTSVRGAAGEATPRHFATQTSEAAGRICSQAVKIVKRSAEQVGRAATSPWRGFGGGDSDTHD